MSKALFKVKAVYEYSSPHDDDLNFPASQIITVTEEDDDEWYTGEYVNSTGTKHEGIFPRNFVEKHEPEIPSRPARPTRTRKDRELPAGSPTMSPTAEAAPDSLPDASSLVYGHEASPDRSIENSGLPVGSSKPRSVDQPSDPQLESSQDSKPREQAQRKPESSRRPPQVADKADAGSFKDRIAAFNKSAASPVVPFKPEGQGSSTSTFIKKPFVAPPPSKSAYVPPPREQPLPTKMYTREDEPDLNETAEDSEASMPLPAQKGEAPGQAETKPTSLKDRIALLQKQQLEQAARHAEAAQKKEKPKKPVKKRSQSQEPIGIPESPTDQGRRALNTTEAGEKKSVDFVDDESESLREEDSRQQPSSALMSTPPPPSRELMSDTNDADYSAAGDTEEADDTSTSREDDREKAQKHRASTRESEPVSSPDAGEESDEEPEEDENVDPEIKRRMELRERMAKMSGGMGLMGMFGPPGGNPPIGRPRASGEAERGVSDLPSQADPSERALRVPVPGTSTIKSVEREPPATGEQTSSSEDAEPPAPQQRREEAKSSDSKALGSPPPLQGASTDRAVPPRPPGRSLPPPLPQGFQKPSLSTPTEHLDPEIPASPPQGRGAPPPPPPRTSMPLSPGELSDDEMSLHGSLESGDNAKGLRSRSQNRDSSRISGGLPRPTIRPVDDRVPASPKSPTSPTAKEKRTSRGLPPLPPSSPPMTSSASPQSRAPPPPPPSQPPSRKSTSQSRKTTSTSKDAADAADASEEEVTEYDGDYDTDIASSAKHKDALKSHARDSSLDDDTLIEGNAPKETKGPPTRGPPPLPSVAAPRSVPPVPPRQPAEHPRRSGDTTRAPPPIPPTAKDVRGEVDESEYDPYRYDAPASGISSPLSEKSFPGPVAGSSARDDLLHDTTRSSHAPPPLPTQAPPTSIPPQPSESLQNAPRRSMDAPRQVTSGRRSMEAPRRSGEQGLMATDIELEVASKWYAQSPDVPPPVLQRRNDILCEIESSTSTKRGGKTTMSKDVYILYMDYSQTVISVLFDISNPDDVTVEQRHERPPPPPRQDQLESASSHFGSLIANSLSSSSSSSSKVASNSTTMGDGTAHGLILDLLRPLSTTVLLPVGTRAYGAVVYANLANASTQQSDEIRPGDIVTFRNAKFAGHRGGLHTKYSIEVGKPDHVAVVADWDGTKKKIRVWEQKAKDGGGGGGGVGGGAAVAKVKEESYRIADLKSGEVRVWRLMGREWVGWDAGGTK